MPEPPTEKDVTPEEAPVRDLRGLPKAGVHLAYWLLAIIMIFVLLMIGWAAVSEFTYFGWLSSQHSSLQTDDVSVIIREHAGFREFWRSIFQIVLSNTLLPVLTAVLGEAYS